MNIVHIDIFMFNQIYIYIIFKEKVNKLVTFIVILPYKLAVDMKGASHFKTSYFIEVNLSLSVAASASVTASSSSIITL